MIKYLSMNCIQCQKLKISSICFHKDCQSRRLCCFRCKSELHFSHPQDLIEIDLLQSLIQQESNKEISYTYGQCQVIQALEEFLYLMDGFQKIIKEEIEKLKQQNLQQFLQELSNEQCQQGIQYWNQLIEGFLQYFQVENCLPKRKNQDQALLNELEENSIQRIKNAQDALQQIIKQFNNFPKARQFKFKSDPIKLEGHNRCVYGVAISLDGNFVVSGSGDKTVRLWDAKQKRQLQEFKYTGEVYGGVAISSTNQYIAYGGDGDYSIQLHDLQSNNSWAFKGHTSYIYTIVFSVHSQFLYSGGNDKRLIIWNISQKAQIHSFETDSSIWTIVTSPDNKLISCVCTNSINIWDFQTKTKLIQEKIHYGRGLCSSKDSSIFITSGDNGLIKIWKLEAGDNNQNFLILTREIKVAAGKSIYKVILTSDEKYIISICNQELQIMIHKMESGNLIQKLHYGIGNGQNYQGYISQSADMNILVSGGEDKMVKFWERE